FSPERPQRVNVIHHQDDERARVVVDATWGPVSWGAPPEPMRSALGSAGRTSTTKLRRGALPAPSGETPRFPAEPPEAKVLATREKGARRELRLLLRSPRGSSTLRVELPEDVPIGVTFDGLEVA